MKARRIGRRALLGAAATIAAAPLLPVLDAGAADGFPLRLVLLYTPDGYRDTSSWAPLATEPLLFGPVHAPLQPFADDVLLLGGVRQVTDPSALPHSGHMAALFTARTVEHNGAPDGTTDWATGPSIDQVVADALATKTPYRSLELAVRPGSSSTTLNRPIYAASGSPVTPESDPYLLYQRIFADIGLELDELARIRRGRKSVIDVVRSDIGALERYYAGAEAEKIEAHLEAIRRIERQLDTTVHCSVDAPEPGLDLGAHADFPAVVQLQIDLLVSALACDLTRVSSLALSASGSYGQVTMSWLGLTSAHHPLAHLGGVEGDEAIAAIDTWYAEQVAYLLQRLAEVPEGDGRLLDNTVVVWGREMANGGHGLHPNAWVVAGGRNTGRIAPARFIDYSDEPHSSVLTTVGRVFGLELDGFGDIEAGRALDWS